MFTFMGTVLFSCNQILSGDFSSLNLSDLGYINGLRDVYLKYVQCTTWTGRKSGLWQPICHEISWCKLSDKIFKICFKYQVIIFCIPFKKNI